jgi:DNA-binding CsgD family transcriptional regulator/tetratricopeptide (TPR) repeat protein
VQQRKGELSLRFTAALVDFDFWFIRGNLREVQRWLREARSLDSRVPPALQVKALYGEGSVTLLLGDRPRARALLQDALALADSIRDRVFAARATLLLGALRMLQEETRAAQAVFENALALSPKDGYPADIAADALIYLGQMSVLEGDLERADAIFAKCLDLARGIGSARIEVRALINVALLKLKRRNIAEAADAASKFIALARAMESRRAFTWAVLIAALANGERGDFDRAARLLGAVDASSEWGDVVSPIFRVAVGSADLHARARKELGEAAYLAAVAAGRSMSVGQIAEMAWEGLEKARSSASVGTAGDPRAARPLLSTREQAVLRLISEGLANKQIATALGISERTVKTHVASVMNKLGVDNRAHAAVAAIQRGLL